MWIVIVECGFIFNTYSEFTMLAVVNNNHHNLSLPAPFLRRPHKANVLVCWAATWWLCTHQFLLHRSHCYSGRQHRRATRHFVDHREQGYHTRYMSARQTQNCRTLAMVYYDNNNNEKNDKTWCSNNRFSIFREASLHCIINQPVKGKSRALV